MVKKENSTKFQEGAFCVNFMKTAGIIAEYNPFHKGHEYQIRYTKESLKADYVIVAMSGDYVQRGTPALISKHARDGNGLCGAVQTLYLKCRYPSLQQVQKPLQWGGVSLLDSLGVVDILCFGSESGEISALKELAEILVEEPEEYKKLLKSFLSEGLTFPAARSQALTEYFKNPRNFNGDDFDGVLTPLLNEVTQILNTPNNILGIEYCKALLRLTAGSALSRSAGKEWAIMKPLSLREIPQCFPLIYSHPLILCICNCYTKSDSSEFPLIRMP